MARPRTTPRTVEHPELSEVSLQQALEALADPVRRMVVCQLAQAGGEKGCGTFETPVSDSTLTHHFTVLREAGVIRQHYRGTAKLNSLREAELEARFPGLLTAVVTSAAAEA